jgi:hypothetical protein
LESLVTKLLLKNFRFLTHSLIYLISYNPQ